MWCGLKIHLILNKDIDTHREGERNRGEPEKKRNRVGAKGNEREREREMGARDGDRKIKNRLTLYT